MNGLVHQMKRSFDRVMRVLTLALPLALGVAGAPAAAQGVGSVVRGGPMADFRDEDVNLLLDAMQRALNAPGEAQPLDWQNAASGAGGTLLVLGPAQHPEFAECRRVRVTLYSRRTKGDPGVWTVCKDPKDGKDAKEPKGRWMLVSAG